MEMTMVIIGGHTHMLQYVHHIVFVLINVLPTAEPGAAPLYQNAGHPMKGCAVIGPCGSG